MQSRRSSSTQLSARGNSSEGSAQDENQTSDFEKLAEEITDRVWALWRKELRRDHERLGHKSRR